jgi:hypothetical protein
MNAEPIPLLRRGLLGVLVALSIESGLGVWVNLYAKIPKRDHGAGPIIAIGRAVADGPVGLGIHAVLGVLLLLATLGLVAFAVLSRDRLCIATTIIGLLCTVGAASNGADFLGHGANMASVAMGELTALAQLNYAIALFHLARRGLRHIDLATRSQLDAGNSSF